MKIKKALSPSLALSILLLLCASCTTYVEDTLTDVASASSYTEIEAGPYVEEPYIEDLEFIIVHKSKGLGNPFSIGYFKGTKVMYIKTSQGNMEVLLDQDGKPMLYD